MAQDKKNERKPKDTGKIKKVDDKIKDRRDKDIPPTKVIIWQFFLNVQIWHYRPQ